MEYLQIVETVLKAEEKPMTIRKIWEEATECGLDKQLKSIGKTPLKTINARIHSNIKSSHPKFKQVNKKPALFDLI